MMMPKPIVLRIVVGQYANALRTAGERIGAAMEAGNRGRWWWQSGDEHRAAHQMAWREFEHADARLHEYVQQVSDEAFAAGFAASQREASRQPGGAASGTGEGHDA